MRKHIQDRGYVKSESKRLYATKIANLISDRLQKSFENIMDYGFTAEMEKSLDNVAEGKESWKKLLEEFYTEFENAKKQIRAVTKSWGRGRAQRPAEHNKNLGPEPIPGYFAD